MPDLRGYVLVRLADGPPVADGPGLFDDLVYLPPVEAGRLIREGRAAPIGPAAANDRPAPVCKPVSGNGTMPLDAAAARRRRGNGG
jgi:hypothetical protein